jgi:hypothetical protein
VNRMLIFVGLLGVGCGGSSPITPPAPVVTNAGVPLKPVVAEIGVPGPPVVNETDPVAEDDETAQVQIVLRLPGMV